MVRFYWIRLIVNSRQIKGNEMSVNLISLSSSEGGSFGEPGDKNWVEFHEGEVIVFKENLEIGTIMSCSFKSYPFFLGRIKRVKDITESVEAWLIISE
jgi:hypothetical protein